MKTSATPGDPTGPRCSSVIFQSSTRFQPSLFVTCWIPARVPRSIIKRRGTVMGTVLGTSLPYIYDVSIVVPCGVPIRYIGTRSSYSYLVHVLPIPVLLLGIREDTVASPRMPACAVSPAVPAALQYRIPVPFLVRPLEDIKRQHFR